MADPDNQNFMTVASTVSDFDHNPVDTYWIAKKFYELMEKYQEDKQLMVGPLAQAIVSKSSAQPVCVEMFVTIMLKCVTFVVVQTTSSQNGLHLRAADHEKKPPPCC